MPITIKILPSPPLHIHDQSWCRQMLEPQWEFLNGDHRMFLIHQPLGSGKHMKKTHLQRSPPCRLLTWLLYHK
jgi:hypothetical protein